ncbi:DNA polymerase III subunit gamma and tau [Leucobacter weissii]|uniref:DNA-directed DNA polymerase n=1 Tax=Leucobacter weissii TaxID=1983706 RepID=A0A939MNC0_9MICO|nr:DNA polymerase III subunit gamma and tau [Leucobacter weissii]
MATALYRRYRPETFSEMIGQDQVTEPLMTALRTGRIGHAYLFSGPRGCGKTTSARILARCLNCAEGPTDTPCGTCPSCVELSREGGGSLDVVEIDAASHGGVDDARDLRERAVFAPARDRFKIFIIDEAHMVTSGGFNALLKIVEEPPPHVKFVFATTEPDKVIGTIRSRTHHYPFRLIAPGTLIDYVQQLTESEGVRAEPGVFPLVVRAGGGSVRDTLSILDQLIAGSEDGSLSRSRATGLLGFTSAELIDEVVVALGSADSSAAFAATDRVVQTGQDPRRFVEDLLERLRDLIVIGATTVQGASAVFRGVPDDQLQRMFEQSQLFAPATLSRIADTVSAALDRMAGATAPRLHLELMVARALVEAAPGSDRPGQPSPGPSRASAPTSSSSASPASSSPASSSPASSSPASPPDPAPPAPATAPVEPASGPSPSVPSASSPPPPTPAAVDIVGTLRSARDFLRNDDTGATGSTGSAGEQRPAEPVAERPAEEQAAVPAPPATLPETGHGEAGVDGADGGEPGSAVDPVGVEELREIWPQLLDELLEGDREAWNAVRAVRPLALEGEVLTIGLASQSDLESFKAAGADPLREVIIGALGLNVKYVPRRMPTEPQPPGGSSGSYGSADTDGLPEPDEEPSPEADSVVARARETSDGMHGGETAPPWSDPPSDSPSPDAGPPYSSSPGPGSSDPGAPDPGSPDPRPPGPISSDPISPASAESTPAPVSAEPTPEPSPVPAPERDPEPIPAPAAAPDPASESEPVSDPAPESGSAASRSAPLGGARQRYGEAVVREVLGARFIEELPLPQHEGEG